MADSIKLTKHTLAILRIFLRCPDICRYQMEIHRQTGMYCASISAIFDHLVSAEWLELLPIAVRATNVRYYSSDRVYYRLTPDGMKRASDMVGAYDANPNNYLTFGRWYLIPKSEREAAIQQRQSQQPPKRDRTLRKIIIHGNERQYRMTPTGAGEYVVKMDGVEPFSARSTDEARKILHRIHGPKPQGEGGADGEF